MADDPYCRHYWRFADEFPDVFDDDHALALWHRLVRLADMAWPAAGQLPYGVRRPVLDKLVARKLIEMVEGSNRFRIRGMDKERTRRSEHGRNAVVQRWQNRSTTPGNTPSTAPSNTQTIPSRAEPSKAEPSTAAMPPEEARKALDGLRAAMENNGIPLPSKTNGRAPYTDVDQVAHLRSVRDDPEEQPWKRKAASDQLTAMRVDIEG